MLVVYEVTKNLVGLSALSFHMREYYWADKRKINQMYRHKAEEYSTEATNKLNIYPGLILASRLDTREQRLFH